MSASQDDIIRDAAKDIVDNFGIWEAEIYQDCQAQQDGDLYEPFMLKCVGDVIRQAIEREARRTCQD